MVNVIEDMNLNVYFDSPVWLMVPMLNSAVSKHFES